MTYYNDIRSIVFDFGGTLDSNGVHSRTLFFEAFLKYNCVGIDDGNKFQEAYSYSDQRVIKNKEIVGSNLFEMNYRMCHHIFEYLKLREDVQVSKHITEVQSQHLKSNKSLLEELSKYFRPGIISNFSGNLDLILKEFELADFFEFTIDSYYFGKSKPSLEIFERAIDILQLSPDKILYVGDNIERDIIPAKKVGMKTALICVKKKQSIADFEILSLQEIIPIMLS